MLPTLDSLLSAFARLMVALQVPFPDFAERMKGHFLRAAERVAAQQGKVTDSRLSLITGLQRRDIARLRAFQPKAPKTSLQAQLVALWQTDPTYSDGGGPLVLARSGAAPSFEALSRQVRQDVHPRSVLDTLLQAGTVRLDKTEQLVTLQDGSYQPAPGSEAQLTYLGRNVADHLDAAVENVSTDPAPHFERAVHYSELTSDQVAELDAYYRQAQMALLQTLSARAAEMKRNAPEAGSQRFRAGGYLYRTDQDGAS